MIAQKVAASPPAIICPCIPILNNPALKATIVASAENINGVAINNVFASPLNNGDLGEV